MKVLLKDTRSLPNVGDFFVVDRVEQREFPLRTELNLLGATTGRFSCAEPNESAKPRGIRLAFDPVALVLQACSNLYGKRVQDIEIKLVSLPIRGKNRVMGFTEFPEDPAEPAVVAINCKLPFMHVPEIIAHEVAHLIAGKEGNHDKPWEVEFVKINNEYNKLADSAIEVLEL